MFLSMKPDIFNTIHPDAFVILTNPGPAPEPVVIAAASTSTKIADIYKAYALESAIYEQFVTEERISVKLALNSTSELYYKTLKNGYTGYAGVTLRKILDNLVTTYSAIDQFDLEEPGKNDGALQSKRPHRDAVCTNRRWGHLRGIRRRPHQFQTE